MLINKTAHCVLTKGMLEQYFVKKSPTVEVTESKR